MFHIKDIKDKKTGLNLQNKVASAVLHPLETTRQSAERNVTFFTLHKLLIPDIPTAEVAKRAPFKTAISYPWLF